MKSALFVDFDNVYSGLRKLDQASADRFARRPQEWMNWIIDSLALPEHVAEGARRRVLVRRCYLNPQAYQRFRPSFNLAGFEIIDCPALTGEGKTSTDIHMVLDIVDLLQHEAHYDEFIVFSADADFTPVLRKLRRWDRRTTVLAIGFPSAAYRASADLLIDQDEFMRAALGFRDEDEAVAPVGATAVAAAEFSVAMPAASPAEGLIEPPTPAEASDADEGPAVVRLIREAVTAAAEPVACGRLASLVLASHPELAADWKGRGSFRRYVEHLAPAGVAFDWSDSGGRAYDPARQPLADRIVQGPQLDWGDFADLLPAARQVHEVTGVPLLHPDKYRQVFAALAQDLGERPFELNETSKRVRDRCREAGNGVSRADVTFVVRGLLFRGHVFGEGRDDVGSLSRKLADNVRSLCLREQMVIDGALDSAIRRWIAGA
ncbi:NYN domain-containing protein [Thauera phenolivorans]|nr:NYN domain-containing protein [Thauera phenolivorans]